MDKIAQTAHGQPSGHPKGLYYLSFTEMWERFSYYGMRALLVLFLVSALGLGGWDWPRSQALALYGTYTALVYITPILGGYIADKIIGYRKAVIIGALIMTLGHISMAIEVGHIFYFGDKYSKPMGASVDLPGGKKEFVKMGAKIYGATTIGPYSKVGGEVNNSVFFGNSNKAHDGFLGNSVIGEWCNLGAVTNNSNLKNNYAEVRLWSYETENFAKTGLQFCGLMMGDHSKCGINTMFNTGTVVGVSANIFGSGFPRNFVPRI